MTEKMQTNEVPKTILTHESGNMTANDVREMIDGIAKDSSLKIQVLRVHNDTTQADVHGTKEDIIALQKALPVNIDPTDEDDKETEVTEEMLID